MPKLMNKQLTLQEIFEKTPSGELKMSTKTFSDEQIQPRKGEKRLCAFCYDFIGDSTFINIQFTKVYFEFGSFNSCRFHNCTFTEVDFSEIKFYECVFLNCQFIKSDFMDIDCEKTIFEACHVLKTTFYSGSFESCQFIKSTPFVKSSPGSPAISNSKFIESQNKALEFKGEILFSTLLHFLDELEEFEEYEEND